MEKLIEKLGAWHDSEVDELNDLAHAIARASSMEEMVASKQVYELQHIKVDTIWDAIEMIQKQK
ncbi:hypothetical protein MKY34_16935 [Sporosarcina sp. FSL K6-1522]|uniref:hypothetical protein n=1 Tax=Sporosarcina sp. FSL K6-1522 TaxID=2921554 RepID=UPI003159C118